MNLFKKYIRTLLTTISPTLSTKILYKRSKGEKLNLKQPKTFSEKLLYLKLNTYYNNPLVTKCADKYMVREYIKEKGFNELLNELIGVYDSVDQIKWKELPQKFVLKCNHGSGYNIICTDKNKLDIDYTKKQLKKWMSEDYWKFSAEVNYKFIKKKIICEKYLDTDIGFLPIDYKIYCFNGEPKAILVMFDRDSSPKGVFMSTNWEFISNVDKYGAIDELPEKPYSLETMISAARKLSEPFPFVRVDFYQYLNQAIFGEMTFTPAGGISPSETEIDEKSMGELLNIIGY